ncbi:anaerobic ribonucleoside-triphosphate reductase [Paucibacter sp. AS339]|uniref:anaerobic ribonucleoside-triphosphate reductase n=1 Tax=Paucibacter hankyongi TaxID=3133434 RepID=UPI00309E1650
MNKLTRLKPSPIDGQPLLREDERQRCEVWTRVMGYHRPVASFNTGKQGEFQQRLHFQEGELGQAGQPRVPLTLCR